MAIFKNFKLSLFFIFSFLNAYIDPFEVYNSTIPRLFNATDYIAVANENKLMIIIGYACDSESTLLMVPTYDTLNKLIGNNKEMVLLRARSLGTVQPIIFKKTLPFVIAIKDGEMVDIIYGIKTIQELLAFCRKVYLKVYSKEIIV